MKHQEIVCENCGEASEVKIGRTFLGFGKAVCPKCSHKNLYPLKQSTNTIYSIAIIGVVLWVIASIGTGNPVYPGLLFFALVFALYKDNKLKKRAKLGFSKESDTPKDPPTEKYLVSDEKISLDQKSLYCYKCGTKLNIEAKFCQNCGAKNN